MFACGRSPSALSRPRSTRRTSTCTCPRGQPPRTGELTLRGRVLPIGGLKEKLLAASRGGMKTVLIPEENAKDLVEISENIKKNLEIVPVSRMDEVLARALVRKPEPIEWDEEKSKPTETSVTTEPPLEEDSSTLTAH